MSDRLRVINLGLPKSGTTTLGHALKVSGLNTADYRIRPHQTQDEDLRRQFVGQLMYDGYFHQGDPLAKMDDFDCFTEINYYAFDIKNVITPNFDGINDHIDFSAIVNYDGFSAEIYDRSGKMVYKASKEKPRWDGFYLRRVLPTSSYWYVIQWNDAFRKQPIILTGWILLKDRN